VECAVPGADLASNKPAPDAARAMGDGMEATTELMHQVVTVTDGFEHRAECSCGWQSEWFLDDVEATEAGLEHPEIAVGPPDPLDGLMTALLDIQEDLAALVVWLAENWSADLPKLGWTANGDDHSPDRPALRVLGYAEPAEFTAAALVVDATPYDDPPTEAGQSGHRHVIRDFGRVRLDIFTLLPLAEVGS
jgi:hypothetical protein